MEKAASIPPSAVILAITTLGSEFRVLGAILAVQAAVVVMIFTREP
jgi:predicted PurR-regulated permease PerM